MIVEDESGMRLSITESQYPHPKENMQLKSILKKNDKKLKLSSKSFSGQSDLKTERDNFSFSSARRKPISMDEPNITCEEFESQSNEECGLSIGFRDDGLARVTSFSPDSITASEDSFQYLPGERKNDSRSKSEPNTRSNSSENLQPLKESSSWECSGNESVVCPSCDRVFPPSTHLQFLDHFEICPNETVREKYF